MNEHSFLSWKICVLSKTHNVLYSWSFWIYPHIWRKNAEIRIFNDCWISWFNFDHNMFVIFLVRAKQRSTEQGNLIPQLKSIAVKWLVKPISPIFQCNTWLELRVQDVFYWFLHKHPTTKQKHSSIKSHSQHISIHSISYVWSNFTNRNGGNFSKAALSSYKLVDNLEATMIVICYQKHRIAFIEASFWNQTFIQLNKQKRFSRSIFIPHIR